MPEYIPLFLDDTTDVVFLRCRTCGALVEAGGDDQTKHDDWHEVLDAIVRRFQ